MRASDSASRLQRAGRVGMSLGAVAVLGGMGLAAAAEAPAEDPIGQGSELFHREWVKGDGRSHGGDGLGPVFNDSSCVACHNAGASGGAGPASKNVDIISAVSTRPSVMTTVRVGRPSGFLQGALETLVGIERPKPPAPRAPSKPTPPDTTELVKAHAGFRTARSVVLHRFSTDPDYESWRWSMKGMGQFGMQAPFGGITNAHRAQAELQQVKKLMQFEGSRPSTGPRAGPASSPCSTPSATRPPSSAPASSTRSPTTSWRPRRRSSTPASPRSPAG